MNYIIGNKITFCQNTYLKKDLDCFGIANYKCASLSINLGIANLLQPFNKTTDSKTTKWYYLAIGSLMWSTVHTRLDIACSVGVVSRYFSNLGLINCSLVVQIFYYLFGTLDLRITFKANSNDKLISYNNSDYVALVNGWKSSGRYIFMLFGGFLSYQSKPENTVALLSTKIKYMAACKARKEATWVSQLLAAFDLQLSTLLINLRIDNKGAIFLIENPEFHWKTKHIEV